MQGNQDLVRVCSQPVSSWSLSSGSTIFKDNILISGYFSFFPILPRLSSSSPPKGWHSYIAQELKNIPPTLFVFLCCAQRLWPKPPLGSQGSFFKVPPPSSAFVFSASSLLGRVSTARQAKLKFHYRCLRVSSWPAWEKKKNLMMLCHPSGEWRRRRCPPHLGSSQTEKSHQNLFPCSSPAHSWSGKLWCPSLKGNHLNGQWSPIFSAQGSGFMKTVSPRTRRGDGFWMIQALYICRALCLYRSYISSTSDHQALDLGGWGHLL